MTQKNFEASVVIKTTPDVPPRERNDFTRRLSRFARRQLNGRGELEHGEIPAHNVLFLQVTAKACDQDELRDLLAKFFKQNKQKFPQFFEAFKDQQRAISNRCERRNN